MSWRHPRWLIDLSLADLMPRPVEPRLRAHLRQCEACRSYYDAGVLALRATRGDAEAPGLGERERLERRALSVADPPREATGWRPGRLGIALAASGLLLLGLLTVWFRPVGVVFAGGQQLEIDGKPAATGADVSSGAKVSALKGDSAVLLAGKRGVLLREGASARFNERGAQAVLEKGRVRFSIKPKQGDFTVWAGEVSVKVRGTIFVVDRRSEEETLVAVHTGEVEVTGAQGVKVTLREGQESVVKRGVASPPRRASKGSLEEDRGDLLIWLKRAWQRLLGNLDQAVGQ